MPDHIPHQTDSGMNVQEYGNVFGCVDVLSDLADPDISATKGKPGVPTQSISKKIELPLVNMHFIMVMRGLGW